MECLAAGGVIGGDIGAIGGVMGGGPCGVPGFDNNPIGVLAAPLPLGVEETDDEPGLGQTG